MVLNSLFFVRSFFQLSDKQERCFSFTHIRIISAKRNKEKRWQDNSTQEALRSDLDVCCSAVAHIKHSVEQTHARAANVLITETHNWSNRALER